MPENENGVKREPYRRNATPVTHRQRMELTDWFLTELARGVPEDERLLVIDAEEASPRTDPETGRKVNDGFWPRPWKPGKGLITGRNSYVCISSAIKTRNPKNGTMRYWRHESAFGHGLAMMVDDVGDGIGSKGSLSLTTMLSILKPTAIVETSPRNFQLWYFLAIPEENPRRFKALLEGFTRGFLLGKGGDATVNDIIRVGRTPFGINNKRVSEGGAWKYPVPGGVWEPSLVMFEPERRYDIDEIADKFAFNLIYKTDKEVKLPQRGTDEWNAMIEENTVNALLLRRAIEITNRLKMGEGTGGEVYENLSGKYRIRCPWGDQHTNGDRYGAYFRGPIPGGEQEYVFGCAHDTCRNLFKHGWGDFVDLLVLPVIEEELEKSARIFR